MSVLRKFPNLGPNLHRSEEVIDPEFLLNLQIKKEKIENQKGKQKDTSIIYGIQNLTKSIAPEEFQYLVIKTLQHLNHKSSDGQVIDSNESISNLQMDKIQMDIEIINKKISKLTDIVNKINKKILN